MRVSVRSCVCVRVCACACVCLCVCVCLQVLGLKRTQVLADNIGFDARPPRDGNVKEKDIDIFHSAWGKTAEWYHIHVFINQTIYLSTIYVYRCMHIYMYI